MATATDMVWVELGHERTKRGEISFGIAGKAAEPRGLISPGDPHWVQALQALEAGAAAAQQGKGEPSGPPPVITLIPREAVLKYQAALAAGNERKRR
jgi:hypothetical protein